MIKLALAKIISGGQTGADRGGLEAAIALNIPHGGYCPKGRLAEDGCVPHRYSLIELSTRDYPTRTLWNIAKSDGTLVFVSSLKEAGPGSRLTIATALKVRKPCRTIELEQGLEAAVRRVRGWFRLCGTVKTVNVAGSRESTTPGIEVAVRDLLVEVLQ
jgi:hypothetical protein